MKDNIHDVLRTRLLARAGLLHTRRNALKYEDLKSSEWSDEFETLMRNRLIIGALRYGKINALNKPIYDRIKGALKRLTQYQQTGNTECLVDVANMALLEFIEGKHPNKHWSDINNDHCCEHKI